MTFACGLDLLLLIPIVIFCVILAVIVVVVLLVLAAVIIYIVLEMLSILIVLGYVAAIPIVFFLTCLVVPFVLAVGVPVLGPLALFVAPKLTIIDYLVSGVCSGFSCIKGLIGDRSCCKNETVNVNIDQPSPSRRRR